MHGKRDRAIALAAQTSDFAGKRANQVIAADRGAAAMAHCLAGTLAAYVGTRRRAAAAQVGKLVLPAQPRTRQHASSATCVISSLAARSIRLYGAPVATGSQGTAMGRRQAVRQRILIPPYGGSNPPAPAMISIT